MTDRRLGLHTPSVYQRIIEQVELGPRFAGSQGHRAAQERLAQWLKVADVYREHVFQETFFGDAVTCRNLWGTFKGEHAGRFLLGTHYDTRPWADCDPHESNQRKPVLGANDGASGVALLAELATVLTTRRDRPTVDVVFFDAEDWHEIDDKVVSLGARRFAEDLDSDSTPDRVLILDMIAGADLMLDVDVTCENHLESYEWTRQLFALGQALDLEAFAMDKQHPYKWVTDDHVPFMEKGIPSALLIDMDFPQWHTVHDLPEACSTESLKQMGVFVEALLFG